MVLKTEGSLSLTEIKDEFKNLSGDVSFSDLWGIAEGVPTTGALSLSIMLGKAYVFLKLVNGTFTNIDLSTLFTAEEWAADTPKEVRFSETSVIGSSITTTPALRTGSGGAGTLKIVNAGTIVGAGGITPSQAGGHAIEVQREGVTIVNTGLIAGGGGAGGNGGQGGQGGPGSFGFTQREPSSGEFYSTAYQVSYRGGNLTTTRNWYWNGTSVSNSSSGAVTVGSVTYYRGTLRSSTQREVRTGSDGDSKTVTDNLYAIYRTYPATAYTTGGLGGAGTTGGRGAGFNQTLTMPVNGALGVAGGTNAGVGGQGGKGGNGGDLGQPGQNGANGGTGSPGNNGAALAPVTGGLGGAAGRAITGMTRVVENTGTILGTVNV